MSVCGLRCEGEEKSQNERESVCVGGEVGWHLNEDGSRSGRVVTQGQEERVT